MRRPELTIKQILAWADDFHDRTGHWPSHRHSRLRISGALGETWCAIDMALRKGWRGLSGKSSLPKLLAQERGVRNKMALPPLSEAQILRWADAHHRRTGKWPTSLSGAVIGAPGETWNAVHDALRVGSRGLSGRSTLARLLLKHRGVRAGAAVPRLTKQQILLWADVHYRRTGRWPKTDSGPIPDAPGETWAAIDAALIQRGRDLRGHWSLARLLDKERGVRNRVACPRLSIPQILRWADSYRKRTGKWPQHISGRIPEAPGETWSAVEGALRDGRRSLGGGSSLFRVLAKYRGAVSRRGPRRKGQQNPRPG
jgi:hypothetical protein